MRLPNVLFINDEQENEINKIFKSLTEKYKRLDNGSFVKNDIFDYYDINHEYGQNVHNGKIKENITLSELELSLICDGGFRFFGGISEINKDKTFKVIIWID